MNELVDDRQAAEKFTESPYRSWDLLRLRQEGKEWNIEQRLAGVARHIAEFLKANCFATEVGRRSLDEIAAHQQAEERRHLQEAEITKRLEEKECHRIEEQGRTEDHRRIEEAAAKQQAEDTERRRAAEEKERAEQEQREIAEAKRQAEAERLRKEAERAEHRRQKEEKERSEQEARELEQQRTVEAKRQAEREKKGSKEGSVGLASEFAVQIMGWLLILQASIRVVGTGFLWSTFPHGDSTIFSSFSIAWLILAAATAGIGYGLLVRKPSVRTFGIALCGIGAINDGFIFGFEVDEMSRLVSHYNWNFALAAASAIYLLIYLIALIYLWRWYRNRKVNQSARLTA